MSRYPSLVVAAIAAALQLLRGLRRLGRRVGAVGLLAAHQPLDRLFDFLDAAPDEFLKLLDLLLDAPQFVTQGGALLLACVVARVDLPGELGPVVLFASPLSHPRRTAQADLGIAVKFLGAGQGALSIPRRSA